MSEDFKYIPRNQRKKNNFKSKSLIFALALLIAVVISGLSIINILEGKIPYKPGQASDGEQLTPIGDKPFNILILGKDSDSFKKPGRTDTIIVMRIDPNRKKAYLISVPRDTRVDIQNQGRGKINSAYIKGDIGLAQNTVENLLNIKIARFFIVNWKGFENIIDAIGGVNVDVEKKMYYQGWRTNIDIKQGKQLLNGKQALNYVRFRNDSLGDLGRIPRQQKFISSIVSQAKQIKNIFKLPQIVNSLIEHTRTNAKFSELLWLGKIFWGIKKNDVSMDTLPGDGKMINGVSYFIADEDTMPLYQLKLGAPISINDLSNKIKVSVYNASGVNGTALSKAEYLRTKGFRIYNVRTAEEKRDKSIILYEENKEIYAKIVATHFPGVNIKLKDKRLYNTSADVLVLVGKDQVSNYSASPIGANYN